MSRQLMFFATALDLGPVLSALEAVQPLRYTTMGYFDTNELQTYLSYAEIPDFGLPADPSALSSETYLLSPQGTQVYTREIRPRSGGVEFAVDLLVNPECISFTPGGRCRDDVILYGAVGIVSNTAAARKLYTFVTKEFLKRFRRHEEFLVGPEAREALDTGARLTMAAQTLPDFDLKRESSD